MCTDKLTNTVIGHIKYCTTHNQKAKILVTTTKSRLMTIRSAMIDYVWETEGVLTDLEINKSYENFNILNKSLEEKTGIRLDLIQRPTMHELYQFADLDTEDYTKIYFDYTPDE